MSKPAVIITLDGNGRDLPAGRNALRRVQRRGARHGANPHNRTTPSCSGTPRGRGTKTWPYTSSGVRTPTAAIGSIRTARSASAPRCRGAP